MNPFPVILSAPSGGGKTRIAEELLRRRSDVGYSVSCTTRSPRAGEAHGEDYFFLTEAEFESRRERGEFAEWAAVHGRLYGTPRAEVESQLAAGRYVVMDIDVQGAAQFLRAFPRSVTIFIVPPSAAVLIERLTARRTEDPAALAVRMNGALAELEAIGLYDYVVVNDDLGRAVALVSSIIDAEAARRDRQPDLFARVGALAAELRRASPGAALT